MPKKNTNAKESGFSCLCKWLVDAGEQEPLIQELFGLLLKVFEEPTKYWGAPYDFIRNNSNPTKSNKEWRYVLDTLLKTLYDVHAQFPISISRYRKDIAKLYQACRAFKSNFGFMIEFHKVNHGGKMMERFFQIHCTQHFYSFLQSEKIQSKASKDMKQGNKEATDTYKEIKEFLFYRPNPNVITPFDCTTLPPGYIASGSCYTHRKLAQEMMRAKKEREKNEWRLSVCFPDTLLPKEIKELIFSFLQYKSYDFPGPLLYMKGAKVQPIDILYWYALELMPDPKRLAQIALTHPNADECLHYFIEKKYIQLNAYELLELSAHPILGQAYFKKCLSAVLKPINDNLQTLLDKCPHLFLSLGSLGDPKERTPQLEKINHLKEVFKGQQSLELFYEFIHLPCNKNSSSNHYKPGPLPNKDLPLYYTKCLSLFPELDKMYDEGKKIKQGGMNFSFSSKKMFVPLVGLSAAAIGASVWWAWAKKDNQATPKKKVSKKKELQKKRGAHAKKRGAGAQKRRSHLHKRTKGTRL